MRRYTSSVIASIFALSLVGCALEDEWAEGEIEEIDEGELDTIEAGDWRERPHACLFEGRYEGRFSCFAFVGTDDPTLERSVWDSNHCARLAGGAVGCARQNEVSSVEVYPQGADFRGEGKTLKVVLYDRGERIYSGPAWSVAYGDYIGGDANNRADRVRLVAEF